MPEVQAFENCAIMRVKSIVEDCMPNKKPKIIVTRKLPDPVETECVNCSTPTLNLDDRPLSARELIEAVKNSPLPGAHCYGQVLTVR